MFLIAITGSELHERREEDSMKEKRKITAWVLTVFMAAALLTGCGSSGQGQDAAKTESSVKTESPAKTESSAKTETPAESKAAPAESAPSETEDPGEEVMEVLEETEVYTVEDMVGEYKGFAAEYMGYTYSLEESGGTTNLTLSADGTGTIDFDGEASAITKWTLEENVVTLFDDTDSAATGTVKHGVIAIDFSGDGSMIAYYAKEGTDTSWVEIMTVAEIQDLLEKGPGTKTYDTYSAIDASTAHLSYELHTDYQNANFKYEVNAKDGVYVSSRTTQVKDKGSTTITYYKDGKVYNLFPSDMTGIFVTETTLLEDNLLGMDRLYQALSSFCRSTKYTEETRDYEGASYAVEVYPEGKYNAETAFYYGADGKLAFVEVKEFTMESGTTIPASFFTINAIDTNVDESMLDRSAYTINEG